MNWLDYNDVFLLPRTAKSPELNPIENIWAISARLVYKNQRQLKIIDDLNDVIMDEWNAIQSAVRNNLIRYMPKKFLDTIERNGSKTHYSGTRSMFSKFFFWSFIFSINVLALM